MKRYLVYLIFAFIAIPVHAMDEAREEAIDPTIWREIIASVVKPFFEKPYEDIQYFITTIPGMPEFKDDPENYQTYVAKREISGKIYKVYRPNHGLAHGLRKMFMAGDIIDLFLSIEDPPEYSSIHFKHNETAESFRQWVVEQVKSDPHFRQKIELAAAFQRTGRQSEITGNDSLEGEGARVRYLQYRDQDGLNFEDYVKSSSLVGKGRIFKDEEEVAAYKRAIQGNPSRNWHEIFLYRILWATHLMDLRRLPIRGGVDSLLGKIQEDLFNNVGKAELTFVTTLWQRSGTYLAATGESDEDPSVNRGRRTNAFYLLSSNVDGLLKALEEIKTTSVSLKK